MSVFFIQTEDDSRRLSVSKEEKNIQIFFLMCSSFYIYTSMSALPIVLFTVFVNKCFYLLKLNLTKKYIF